jgi:AraC-like DNA-binding protein
MAKFAQPAPDLADRVDLFWSARGDGGPGTSFHELFPDSGANLVLRLSPAGCRAVLLGPVIELATVERDRRAEYLGVRFRTGRAPALADVRSSELTDGHVELDAVLGVRLDDLAERLVACPDFTARRRILEELIRGAPPLVRSARARRLAGRVEAEGGRLRVDDLAGLLGLHVRSVERLCLDELGLSPKRLTRLVRIRHAVLRLHAGRYVRLADLALECGYADQAHMVRDFRALTGRLPGEREALRPRQLQGSPGTPVVHRVRGRAGAPR